MKHVSILLFLYHACAVFLPAQNLNYELIDDENLLPQPLMDNLPSIVENAVSFITPFKPVGLKNMGDGESFYTLRVFVRGKSASHETGPAMESFTFDCEIIPGTVSGTVSDPVPIEKFSFTCAGAGIDTDEAGRNFIENFRDQLIFELMFQPSLRKDICVLYLFGKDAVLSLPRETEVRIGTEYDMNLPGKESGQVFAGRLVVTGIEDSYALGRMLYQEIPLKPGAVGEPAGTSGLETRIHAGVLLKEGQNAFAVRLTEGLRLPVPWLVPIIGLQIPFFMEPPLADSVPFTFLLGGRVPWFLGKMQLYSTLAGGIGFVIGESSFYAGLLAEIGFELRMSRFVSLSLSAGYTGWTPLAEGFAFSGFFLGLGAGFFY